MINVKFFARLRDQLGTDGVLLEAAQIATVMDVQRALVAQHSHWQEPLQNADLLVAVNQSMARLSAGVTDGDEVAFFPPVTGG